MVYDELEFSHQHRSTPPNMWRTIEVSSPSIPSMWEKVCGELLWARELGSPMCILTAPRNGYISGWPTHPVYAEWKRAVDRLFELGFHLEKIRVSGQRSIYEDDGKPCLYVIVSWDAETASSKKGNEI